MILSVMAHEVGTYWKMHFKEFGKERPIRRRKKLRNRFMSIASLENRPESSLALQFIKLRGF